MALRWGARQRNERVGFIHNQFRLVLFSVTFNSMARCKYEWWWHIRWWRQIAVLLHTVKIRMKLEGWSQGPLFAFQTNALIFVMILFLRKLRQLQRRWWSTITCSDSNQRSAWWLCYWSRSCQKDSFICYYNHISVFSQELGGEKSSVELGKSNILLIGPTGSGKTLLAETYVEC